MMMNDPIRSDDVASPTTPLGWRTMSSWHPPSGSAASTAPQRRATAAGDGPLNRGRGLNALPARRLKGLAILPPDHEVDFVGRPPTGVPVRMMTNANCNRDSRTGSNSMTRLLIGSGRRYLA